MTSAAERIPDRLSRRWVAGQLGRLPGDWSETLEQGWRKRWQSKEGHEGDRRRSANGFIRETLENLSAGSELPLTADEDAIRARAVVRSRQYQLLRKDITPAQQALLVEDTGAITPEGALERLCCDRWWRRRLRKSHGRAVEQAGIKVGMVRSSRQVYVTDASVNRRRQQKSRNRKMLEEMLAINECGDELSLSAVVDASVSNPVLRRGELMCRMAGMEWVAKAAGWRGYFVTLTAPSAYHPTRSYGRKIVDNPLYEGFTPREAQAWLSKIWSRIRAALKRIEVEWFGIRVAEPHGDGTPHWHLLLFWQPKNTKRIVTIFRARALSEYGDEKGARRFRVQIKRIDTRRGSATGYVAKYVAKNIDGAYLGADDTAIGNDLVGRDPIAMAERVDAWASTWGIRQFQFAGMPSVTVWRELRRVREEQEPGELELLRCAADAGNWDVFVHTIRQLELRPALVRKESGECDYVNRYGEPIDPPVVGVRVGDQALLTRTHTWSIKRKEGDEEIQKIKRLAVGGARPRWHGVKHGVRISLCFKRAGAARAPWSPVNNCTGVRGEQGCDRRNRAAGATQGVSRAIPAGAECIISGCEGQIGGAAVHTADDKHRAITGNPGAGGPPAGDRGG